MWCKLLLVACALAALNVGANAEPTSVLSDEPRHRQKRNLAQFALMIFEVTGRNPLDFNGYGCYCGWGGAGVPVDAIDRCCQVHDLCYKGVSWPKLTIYDYAAAFGAVTCNDPLGTNKRAVCECDAEAVRCFFRNLALYRGKPRCPGKRCLFDLVFLIDTSWSIGRKAFKKAKNFISNMVGCFNGTDTNVGVIQYNCTPKVDIPLGSYTDIPSLQSAILNDVEFSGGRARTGGAIRCMTSVTNFREGARKVAFVATDGRKQPKELAYATDEYVEYSEKARDAGIELWTIATGRDVFINEAGLKIISDGNSRLVSLDQDDPCEVGTAIEECTP